MLIIVPCQVKHSLSTSDDRGTSRWHRRAAPRFCTLRREIGFKVVNFDKSFLHRFLHKSHKISHRTVWSPKESKNNKKFKDEKRNKKPVPRVCWGQTLCQKIAFFLKTKLNELERKSAIFNISFGNEKFPLQLPHSSFLLLNTSVQYFGFFYKHIFPGWRLLSWLFNNNW